jgi:hypothetical protein
MALAHSPQVVTDGLVFYYDMGNPQKSWKGAPTVNLITNPTNEVIATVNEFTVFQDLSPIFDAQGPGTYSISADIKTTIPGAITVYTASGEVEYNIGYYTANCQTYYQRFYFNNINVTRTDPAVSVSNLSFYGTYGTGVFPSIKNVQVEKNSFCTPFVIGTRSNTQAIVDLTGNNTWTVNNLTYSSDQTFSFNGSNSWIESPTSSVFDTQTVTMESWCYPTVTAQYGFLFEKGQVNAQYSNFFNGDGTFYFRTVGLSPLDLTFASASYITANAWNHIVCTYGSGTKTIYVNGVQIAQQTGVTGTMPTGQTNQYVGKYGNAGNNYPFNGKIAVSKVYNRALTASEVQQNFNALRGRYGI